MSHTQRIKVNFFRIIYLIKLRKLVHKNPGSYSMNEILKTKKKNIIFKLLGLI